MSTSSYADSVFNGLSKKNKKRKGKISREQTPPPMWLLEICVTPKTANTGKWLSDYLPMATQLLLSNRPAYLLVRDSWNPTPFEHYPSAPATCRLFTPDGRNYVSTDAKIWSRQEIRATCEDCDFVSGNMWFYIPSDDVPRSPDDLFENVIDPLLEWNRTPSGVGELIGCAEDALSLMYWNPPNAVVDVGVPELKRIAHHLGIVIENDDAMVIDLLLEDFYDDSTSPAANPPEDVPRRIPIRDWFWVGIVLIILQLIYLVFKFEVVRNWFF